MIVTTCSQKLVVMCVFKKENMCVFKSNAVSKLHVSTQIRAYTNTTLRQNFKPIGSLLSVFCGYKHTEAEFVYMKIKAQPTWVDVRSCGLDKHRARLSPPLIILRRGIRLSRRSVLCLSKTHQFLCLVSCDLQCTGSIERTARFYVMELIIISFSFFFFCALLIFTDFFNDR